MSVNMEISLEKMTFNHLALMNLDDFDDFWNFHILEEELSHKSSFYIIAKSENDIIGFAGLNFILDEAHITNIVTKKNKRNLRNWNKTVRITNQKGKTKFCFNHIRSKCRKLSCNSFI